MNKDYLVTSTIFVHIAAYRDPDLVATLYNLIKKAAHPERLKFGICLQLDPLDPMSWREEVFPDHAHLQVMHVDAADSRGVCWARSQAQRFYDGEDFLLQIDSHMRAIQNWDDLLVQTWRDCNYSKAVLSVYPNSFYQPCQLETNTLPVMAAHRFDDYNILLPRALSRYQMPDQQPEKPLPSAFIAGGFLFGPGSIIENVPYDPDLYFCGEEISMAVRLWTHGYNIYCPNRLLLFHLYRMADGDGNTSATHWSDHEDWFQLNRRSMVRVHTLLKSIHTAPETLSPSQKDIASLIYYGLGEERTLSDYQSWAGIDFSMQKIEPKAIEGAYTS